MRSGSAWRCTGNWRPAPRRRTFGSSLRKWRTATAPFPGATYRAVAKAIQVSIPKAGTTVTDPKLRDVDLIQWVADFLSAMFNLDKVDVRGGHTKEEKPAAGGRSVVSFLEGDRPRR